MKANRACITNCRAVGQQTFGIAQPAEPSEAFAVDLRHEMFSAQGWGRMGSKNVHITPSQHSVTTTRRAFNAAPWNFQSLSPLVKVRQMALEEEVLRTSGPFTPRGGGASAGKWCPRLLLSEQTHINQRQNQVAASYHLVLDALDSLPPNHVHVRT